MRVLARKPEDRFPTIGELANALRQWLETGDARPSRASNHPGGMDFGAVSDPEPAMQIPAGYPEPLPEPVAPRKRASITLSPEIRMAMVSVAVWGSIILAVVILIRILFAGL